MASKFVFVFLAARPSSVVLFVPWIYSRLGTDEWPFSPSSLLLEFNISLVVMLLKFVAQHGEVLCALLRQQILWTDDLKVKSSVALFGKEVGIAVMFLPLLEELPYQWRAVVSSENCWLKPLVFTLNSSFLVHKNFVVPSSRSKLGLGRNLVWRV